MRYLLILSAVLLLVNTVQAQPNVIVVKDLIEIDSPSKINVSESAILKIKVYIPNLEELGELAGTPAGLTKLTVSTTLGNLTEINTSTLQPTNNTGDDIVVYSNDSGVAIVQFESNTPGNATITVRAPAITDLLNSLRGNNTTAYLVMNSTEIEVVSPPTTVTPTETTTVTTTPVNTTVTTPVTTTPTETVTETTVTETTTPTETTITETTVITTTTETVTTTTTVIPTETTTVTETVTETTATTTTPSGPGFEVILALLAVVAIALRRHS